MYGERVNGSLAAGVSGQDTTKGLTATFVEGTHKVICGVGATHGLTYFPGGYFNPPPMFLHEWTRSLLFLSPDTVVVYDRTLAFNPRLAPKLNRWRGYAAQSGAVQDNAPTTSAFVTGYKGSVSLVGYNLTFTTGPNAGKSNTVLTYVASAGQLGFAAPWPTAPENGDIWSAAKHSSDAERILNAAKALTEIIFYCPVAPDISDPAVTSWSTPGRAARST